MSSRNIPKIGPRETNARSRKYARVYIGEEIRRFLDSARRRAISRKRQATSHFVEMLTVASPLAPIQHLEIDHAIDYRIAETGNTSDIAPSRSLVHAIKHDLTRFNTQHHTHTRVDRREPLRLISLRQRPAPRSR